MHQPLNKLKSVYQPSEGILSPLTPSPTCPEKQCLLLLQTLHLKEQNKNNSEAILMCSLTNSLQHKLQGGNKRPKYIYVLSLLTVITWKIFENSPTRSQHRWSVSRSPHRTGTDRIYSEAGTTLQRLHNSAHSCLCQLHYPPPQFTWIQKSLDEIRFLGKATFDKTWSSGLCL